MGRGDNLRRNLGQNQEELNVICTDYVIFGGTTGKMRRSLHLVVPPMKRLFIRFGQKKNFL